MRRLFAACLLVLPAAARGATDPLPYLPADTDALLTIEARKVAESELGKKFGADLLKELLGISKPATAAVNATGLDPMRDIDFITVGLHINGTNVPKPFALLEGKFDRKKIEDSVAAYMKEHPTHITAITVAEKPAYRVNGGKPTDAMYAAIIDETKIVVAPTEQDLAGAFEAAAGKRKPVASKEVLAFLGAVKPTTPIYVRAWVKGKFKDVNLPNEKLKAAVQGVDWATLGILVTKDVSLTVVLNAPDDASAQKLSDLVGPVVGLVALQVRAAAEDQPELKPVADLLKATKVGASGRMVIAYGVVKGEEIEKALQTPAPKPPATTPKKK
jgi:hypothetical protein